MIQLHQDIKQSFESIESLIKRQGELELFVRERLNDIGAKLDELLFLAPVSQTLPGGDRWSYQDEARPQMPAEPGEHIPMRPLTPGEQNNASMRPLTPGEQSNTSMSTPDQNESLHVSELKVAAIRSKSCSRKNYATNLARELFTMEERCTRNVSGKFGKQQLDPGKIFFIKKSCFEHFPLSNTENSHKAWQDCVKAIDSAGRGLLRKSKENIL